MVGAFLLLLLVTASRAGENPFSSSSSASTSVCLVGDTPVNLLEKALEVMAGHGWTIAIGKGVCSQKTTEICVIFGFCF